MSALDLPRSSKNTVPEPQENFSLGEARSTVLLFLPVRSEVAEAGVDKWEALFQDAGEIWRLEAFSYLIKLVKRPWRGFNYCCSFLLL